MEFEKVGGIMQYREIEYRSEKEWHDIRKKFIGGSDCSIVLGSNPYDDDIVKLWRIKTGREQPEDLSNNEGKESEPHLRNLFRAKNKQYEVSELNKTLISNKYPFMSANIDGVLEHKELGKGVLEIKTATCNGWKKYEKDWGKEPPLHYYLQVQHYLAVTGWKYAVLFAEITFPWIQGDDRLRTYFIERDEEDIEEIVKKEVEFYNYIKNDIQPPYIKKLEI